MSGQSESVRVSHTLHWQLRMTHSTESRSKEREAGGVRDDDDPGEKISYAKVVILGASGVGKSSIIKV